MVVVGIIPIGNNNADRKARRSRKKSKVADVQKAERLARFEVYKQAPQSPYSDHQVPRRRKPAEDSRVVSQVPWPIRKAQANYA
jgi:hypothetical protein